MKKILALLLCLALIVTFAACSKDAPNEPSEPEVNVVEDAANAYFANYPGSRIITWDDLFAKIDAGEKPFILSIRSEDDYNAGHIVGAYLAAWGNGSIADAVEKLPKDQTVYVYCYSGQTAGQTVAVLNMAGINAVSVKSGFNKGAMTVEGYEAYVETTANELPNAGAEFDAELLAFAKEYFAAIPTAGDNNKINSESLNAAFTEGDTSYYVVDIRKAEDFAAGHIEGAVNIPFGKDMQANFTDLPTDKTLVVACYSGQTAGQTTAVLRALGYEAKSLHFGMKLGWIAEGYPVVSE